MYEEKIMNFFKTAVFILVLVYTVSYAIYEFRRRGGNSLCDFFGVFVRELYYGMIKAAHQTEATEPPFVVRPFSL